MGMSKVTFSELKVFLRDLSKLTPLELLNQFYKGDYTGSMQDYTHVTTLYSLSLESAFIELNGNGVGTLRSFSVGDLIECVSTEGTTHTFLCRPNGWEEVEQVEEV